MTALMESPQAVTRRMLMRDTGQLPQVRADAADWLIANGCDADRFEASRALRRLRPVEARHG